ncbi:enhancer of yellow 2 transcription factor-like protein B-like protein [Thamnidium elegans]|nr:enhancer of yellow 2 transcription factor-like protein B-like protein [Thamnidium elegans]
MSESEKEQAAVNRLFVESGEKERLLQILRARLSDSGWNDSLDAHCRDTIRNKNVDNISLDELLKDVEDHGKTTIQESIKKDLLEQIKKFLDEHLE